MATSDERHNDGRAISFAFAAPQRAIAATVGTAGRTTALWARRDQGRCPSIAKLNWRYTHKTANGGKTDANITSF